MIERGHWLHAWVDPVGLSTGECVVDSKRGIWDRALCQFKWIGSTITIHGFRNSLILQT